MHANQRAVETANYLINQLRIRNIGDVKVFPKQESLLKEEPTPHRGGIVTRAILAHAYFVAAIFSPVFLKMKKRLKTLLKDNVVYSDGMSPLVLQAWLSRF